jgi:general secretion pathway protein A
MYEQHWQLSTRPFVNGLNPDFYYPSDVHQTAGLKLRYAIESCQSAVVLCGESGMGKTTLIQTLLSQFPENLTPTVRIVFPQLSGDQLIGYLVDKLTGSTGDANEPTRLTLARLESFLDANVERGNQALMIIDESHLLTSTEQWETLRLLLNFGNLFARGESALTLVFVGHPTLLSMVERNRSLDDRIAAKCILHRFTPIDSAGYVQHRMRTAGCDAENVFSAEAIETLHHRSGGIPRRINRLADLALMVGYAEELDQISADHIESVYGELVTTP